MKYLAVHFDDSELSDNEILIDKHVRLVNDESIIQLDEFEVGCNVAVLEKIQCYYGIDYPIIRHEHIVNIAGYYISGEGHYKTFVVIESNGDRTRFPILGEIKFYKDKQ